MKRKALSLILAFAMAVSLFTVGASAAEPTYGDTAGHWAEASIERWSGYGIIQGCHLLKALPPIDVDVLSSTHKRVPFLDLSLIFSVISRFLLAFISKDIYFEIL